MSPTETTTSIFTRKYFNVLVTGHRENRLPTAPEQLALVSGALHQVLESLRQAIADTPEPPILRLFTGWSEGADEMARTWFYQHQAEDSTLKFYAVSPENAPEDEADKAMGRVGISREVPNEIPESWHAVTDDYKLLMADVVVCVWDGKMANGCAGGTVRVVADAMRRRLPIIWIHADAAQAGTLKKSEVLQLNSTVIQALDASDPDSIAAHFSDLPNLCDLKLFIKDCVDFTRQNKTSKISDKSDPGACKTFAGFWHSAFFSWMSPWTRKKVNTSVGSWRGPDEFVNASHLGDGYWEIFHRKDRTATHAANQHRDSVIVIHLLSSLAVFGAVAGSFHFLHAPHLFWVIFEFAALALIGGFVWHGREKKNRLSARNTWLLSRQSAEAMRISALLYPQLASLPMLYQLTRAKSAPQAGAAHGAVTLDMKSAERMKVIQMLGDAEPPAQAPDKAYYLADNDKILRDGLCSLIESQINYHETTAKKYEAAHHNLHRITQYVFFAVLFVVALHGLEITYAFFFPHDHGILAQIGHWIADQKWLLLITAFFPALAAALHGILTSFELERLSKNSERMVKRLGELQKIIKVCDKDPIKLRRYAVMTSELMFSEHDDWSSLMKVHQLDLPV